MDRLARRTDQEQRCGPPVLPLGFRARFGLGMAGLKSEGVAPKPPEATRVDQGELPTRGDSKLYAAATATPSSSQIVTAGVPRVQFDSRDVPPRHRFAAFAPLLPLPEGAAIYSEATVPPPSPLPLRAFCLRPAKVSSTTKALDPGPPEVRTTRSGLLPRRDRM